MKEDNELEKAKAWWNKLKEPARKLLFDIFIDRSYLKFSPTMEDILFIYNSETQPKEAVKVEKENWFDSIQCDNCGNLSAHQITNYGACRKCGSKTYLTNNVSLLANTIPKQEREEGTEWKDKIRKLALSEFPWPKNNEGEFITLPPAQATPIGFNKFLLAFTKGYEKGMSESSINELVEVVKWIENRINENWPK